MQAKGGQVAKFMPRWDGPFKILEAFLNVSTYKLDLPDTTKQYPMFHVSQLQPHHENNAILFPLQELEQPGPIITINGMTEYFIDHIIDE